MTTKQDVLDFFEAETEADARRHVYKYTDCGAWIEFSDTGIRLGSIVEGADFGTAIYPLNYADGFTGADIQARLDAIEAEAAAIWDWANSGPDNEQTWADLGIDAPDVAAPFVTDGRSS